MRALFWQWIAQSRATMRRDVAVLTMVVALGTAACGGSSATTYSPACASPKFCYAVAEFYKPATDYASIPQGVFNDVPINTMACNSACIMEGGAIYNYLILGDTTGHSFAEVGETDNAFNGGSSSPIYYDALYLSGSKISFNVLGGGIGAVGDLGQTGDFELHFINSACTGSQTGLSESGSSCAATTAPSGVYVTVAVPSGTHTAILLFSGTSTITPGLVEFGMKLQGTQGESATGRLWDSGNYAKLALSTNDVSFLGSAGEIPTNFPHSFINGGKVLSPAPPFGTWIGLEGDDYIWFETWCCSV